MGEVLTSSADASPLPQMWMMPRKWSGMTTALPKRPDRFELFLKKTKRNNSISDFGRLKKGRANFFTAEFFIKGSNPQENAAATLGGSCRVVSIPIIEQTIG
jgi:hypothetical protein